MKSPCLDLGNGQPCELADADKNNDVCKNCEARLKAIGKHSGISVAMEVEGKRERIKDKGLRIMKAPTKINDIDALINEICSEEGIIREDLQKRDPAGKYRSAKVRVAQALKKGRLKNREIATMMGVPVGSIQSYIVDKTPGRKEKHTEVDKPQMPDQSMDIEDLPDSKSKDKTAAATADARDYKIVITIDVSDFIKDALTDFVKYMRGSK